MKLLSERLKWAMEEKSRRDGIEVSPADVARAAGVSDTSASYWLSGTNGISAARARMVAEYLGVNALWLENGSGKAKEGQEAVVESNTGPANDPHQLGRDELIDLISGFSYGDADERRAIMAVCRRVLKRIGKGRGDRPASN